VPALTITSPDDPRIGDYRALTDVELRTRWEPPNGLFIAEGELVIERALRAGYTMRSALVDEKRVDQLSGLPPEAPLYTAPPAVPSRSPGSMCTGASWRRSTVAPCRRCPSC
jgi:hypothetical protein